MQIWILTFAIWLLRILANWSMRKYEKAHDDDYRMLAILLYYVEAQVRIKKESLQLSKVAAPIKPE